MANFYYINKKTGVQYGPVIEADKAKLEKDAMFQLPGGGLKIRFQPTNDPILGQKAEAPAEARKIEVAPKKEDKA
jgi:hypothetical protein